MKFTYTSPNGSIDLNDEDILLIEGNNLFGFSYKLESTPKLNGVGELFNKTTLPRRSVKFSLLIKGNIEFNLSRIEKLLHKDINDQTPGRLSLNGSYIECYITESSKKHPQKYSNAEVVEFVASVLTPLWITEKQFDFSVHSNEDNKNGFKLPMRFPTSFVSTTKKSIVDNLMSAETLAEITFFGPVKDPIILIDNTPYSIKGELLANERYVIDQRSKTVKKITAFGDIVNAFKFRQKTPSVFNPFPQGEHVIGYDGTFSVRIIMFEGSVEPSWS